MRSGPVWRYIDYLQSGPTCGHECEVAGDVNRVGETRNSHERDGGRREALDNPGRRSNMTVVGGRDGAGAVGAGKHRAVRRAKIADGKIARGVICPSLRGGEIKR